VKGGKAVPDFVSDKIVGKEITLRGAIGVSSSAYRRALAWLGERDRAPLERMHTHALPLREAERALRTLAGETQEPAVAVCLQPEESS
jgi:threonine dehydrogenase-like Zn-dependent dehydrogenase